MYSYIRNEGVMWCTVNTLSFEVRVVSGRAEKDLLCAGDRSPIVQGVTSHSLHSM